MNAHFQYTIRNRDKIDGWFSFVDAEIFYLLTTRQNEQSLAGAVAEIGLHHGKSFVALCLALKKGEKAYGIDVFENQKLNLDQSGMGARTAVEGNLLRFSIDLSLVTLDPRASQEVKSDDILKSVGPVRFFSIDGGHWFENVRNDLVLAEKTIADHGVIALDDFLRSEWPDVTAAYFDWYQSRPRQIVPLAIGFNKLYLCSEGYLSLYKNALEQSDFLGYFMSKRYRFCGHEIPIYQTYQLPEFGFRKRLAEYCKLYYPNIYVALKKVIRSRPSG